MDICVDFDGTCVTHEFPKIGKDIGAIPVLKKLVENGHNLILFTMRSDRKEGNYLSDAVKWFEDNGIKLYGINKNPTQEEWTSSPKAYGNLYIDDAGLGSPILYNRELSNRPYVNWELINTIFVSNGIIKSNDKDS